MKYAVSRVQLPRRPIRNRPLCTRCELSVGVDLGTTNSAVSVLKDGVATIVPNPLGQRTTPSVVTYLENGDVVVGHEAKRLASRYPKTTYASVKRLLGKEFDRLQQGEYPFAFDLVRGDAGEIRLKCDHSPVGYIRPEDVSAEVVRYLLRSVQDAHDGEEIKRCVISVPAYFDEQQRAATVAAGMGEYWAVADRLGELCAGLSAGLEKVRLIHEPVASALAYGLDLMKDQTVCVFDLGGGTLDICVLELGKGVTEVLATGGDSQLGGDDMDRAIVNWLLKEHLAFVPSVRKTPTFLSNLKQLAEAAKIKLSTSNGVVVRIPLKGDHVEARLTRNQLEKLCKPLFIEMRSALDRCCWQAGVDLVRLKDQQETQEPVEIRMKAREPISEILLVGAATKMPAVGRFLRNMTGLEVHESKIDPDECVAMGAAIEAGRLSGKLSEDFMIMDVWQASLLRAIANEQIASE